MCASNLVGCPCPRRYTRYTTVQSDAMSCAVLRRALPVPRAMRIITHQAVSWVQPGQRAPARIPSYVPADGFGDRMPATQPCALRLCASLVGSEPAEGALPLPKPSFCISSFAINSLRRAGDGTSAVQGCAGSRGLVAHASIRHLRYAAESCLHSSACACIECSFKHRM